MVLGPDCRRSEQDLRACTHAPKLPPGLKRDNGYRVGKVKRPTAGLHRNPHNVIKRI